MADSTNPHDDDRGPPSVQGDESVSNLSDEKALRAAVEARAAERAQAPAATPPAPLSESIVLRCEMENFLGDAKIYAHLHRDTILYVQLWEKWLYWDGHHWELDIGSSVALAKVEAVAQEYLRIAGQIAERIQPASSPEMSAEERSVLERKRNALLARAKRCRSRDRKTVLEFVHSGLPEPLAIMGNELDGDPWLLGVSNGVIDLRDQSFRPGRPDDYITMVAPTEWRGLDAEAKPFLDFLGHMLEDNEELVRFMLCFLGMALFAGQREHKFLVLFGEGGRNGKDTLMGILRDVLGAAMCSDVPPEMFMEQSFVRDAEKPAPMLLKLRGKRIAYASESSRKHRFDSETVKRLTGGNSLSARGMHTDNVITWEMTHTVILLTNALPAAPAGDDAFWTRVLGIELRRRYVDHPDPKNTDEYPKDPDMRAKIAACSSGVLACLVRGFGDYLAMGLSPPPEVTAFGETYRKQEDVVGRFLEECCTIHEDPEQGKTQASELKNCFAWWFTFNISSRGYPPKRFTEDLRKKGFESRKISNNFYMGITITPETMAEWEAAKREKQGRKEGSGKGGYHDG